MDRAHKILQNSAELQDAWSQICPETELARLEDKDAIIHDSDNEQEYADTNIPELMTNATYIITLEKNNTVTCRAELLLSLNQEQSAIFYKVKAWCLQKSYGNNPEPIHNRWCRHWEK